MGELQAARARELTWEIDRGRSHVGFSVRHLMVATVHGRFADFTGRLSTGSDGLIAAAGEVAAGSVDTGDPKRDERLREPSFFDARRTPSIRFESRRIERRGPDRYRVIGDLTIKRTTNEVVLDATMLNGRPSHDELRLEARGEIRRSEFGLSWREVLEAAGAVVSDRVRLALELVAVPNGPAPAHDG